MVWSVHLFQRLITLSKLLQVMYFYGRPEGDPHRSQFLAPASDTRDEADPVTHAVALVPVVVHRVPVQSGRERSEASQRTDNGYSSPETPATGPTVESGAGSAELAIMTSSPRMIDNRKLTVSQITVKGLRKNSPDQKGRSGPRRCGALHHSAEGVME